MITAHLPNNPNPVGFYALTIKLELESELQPTSIRERASRIFSRSQSGYFASVQLCWIAVNRSMQRRAIGTKLMGSAIGDFYEIAVRTGIYALTLTAINADVAAFYEKLGFVTYGADSAQPKMLLPAKSVIEMIEGR